MMPQPIGAPDAAATPTNNAPKTPNAASASASIMQFMERFDQSDIKWKKWLQRLENAMEVGAVSKTIKPKMLLHCIGAKAYDELTDLVAPAKPESMQYDELTKILTEHFEPEPLEMMELLAFRNRNQQEGESIKEYTRALLHKANDCGFGDHIQKALELPNELMKPTKRRASKLPFPIGGYLPKRYRGIWEALMVLQ
ncbi:uncharacterized protein LOC125948751 [Anopheles darlingi]|uniref:uncharacterized protein LOC125948751 n=1 Tax=Anopheles darlingi TaxID=43151 RepID=UPI002100312A|nr:uncharacterized protein LOC125948751 [Anopheles darlingi]